MCQYSSILQAISNIPQYSSILPEQLGDAGPLAGPGLRRRPGGLTVSSDPVQTAAVLNARLTGGAEAGWPLGRVLGVLRTGWPPRHGPRFRVPGSGIRVTQSGRRNLKPNRAGDKLASGVSGVPGPAGPPRLPPSRARAGQHPEPRDSESKLR